MKKIILIFSVVAFALCMSSCEKEVIEIINESENIDVNLTKSSGDGDTSGSDITDNVTDPNEDEDFDADKKKLTD